MSVESFTTYEAKARFSELLRKVRRNKRVVITCRGRPVAELVPYRSQQEPLEDRLGRLEQAGIVESRGGSHEDFVVIVRRPGALRRFLEERE